MMYDVYEIIEKLLGITMIFELTKNLHFGDMIRFTFWLTKSQKRELRKLAKQAGVSQSMMCRECLFAGISEKRGAA